MKNDPSPPISAPATLKDVIDGLMANPSISETRKRDLRSGVVCFAKLTERPPAFIPLDLAALRADLDGKVPAQAKVSAKRFANLRSDLNSAIEASGLRPMLKTAGVEPNESWARVLHGIPTQWIRYGLSRLSRWASQRQIVPTEVDDAIIKRFIADLEAASLIRNIRDLNRSVTKSWNALVRLQSGENLKLVNVPKTRTAPGRIPWAELPASFQADVNRHLAWGADQPIEAKYPDLPRRVYAGTYAPGTVFRLTNAAKFEAAFGKSVFKLDTLCCRSKPQSQKLQDWMRDSQSVLVELSPACDVAQGYRVSSLLVAGVIVPAAYEEETKPTGGAFERLPTFKLRWAIQGFSEQDVILVLCHRFKITLPAGSPSDWLEPWFRLRELPLASIRNANAAHAARVGYVSVE